MKKTYFARGIFVASLTFGLAVAPALLAEEKKEEKKEEKFDPFLGNYIIHYPYYKLLT